MGSVVVSMVDGYRVVKMDGKVVGTIIGDKYVTKRGEEHIFRKFNAFGISVDVLKTLEGFGVKEVLIIFSKDGGDILYSSSLYDWLESELEWVDESQGKPDRQKLLPIIQMNCLG